VEAVDYRIMDIFHLEFLQHLQQMEDLVEEVVPHLQLLDHLEILHLYHLLKEIMEVMDLDNQKLLVLAEVEQPVLDNFVHQTLLLQKVVMVVMEQGQL
jgi:hypothetical protein